MSSKIIKLIYKNKLLIIGLVIGVILCMMNKKEDFIGGIIDNIKDSAELTHKVVVEKQLTELSKKTVGKRGVQGKKGFDGEEGIRGSQGEKGGTFIHKGVLRNLATNNFLDRDFFDGDVEASAFMNDATYQPSQYWRLDSDNKIRNQYGAWEQCLATDGLKVYVDKCDKLDPKSNWRFNKYGLLKSKYHGSSKGTICLTTNKDSRGNIKLQMKKCDETNYPKNQQWSFY